MTETNFLLRLEKAIKNHRAELHVENPSTRVNALRARSNYGLASAQGHTEEQGIFIRDDSHNLTLDNPVVKAVEWLGRPSGNLDQLSFGDYILLRGAWEYFQAKLVLGEVINE